MSFCQGWKSEAEISKSKPTVLNQTDRVGIHFIFFYTQSNRTKTEPYIRDRYRYAQCLFRTYLIYRIKWFNIFLLIDTIIQPLSLSLSPEKLLILLSLYHFSNYTPIYTIIPLLVPFSLTSHNLSLSQYRESEKHLLLLLSLQQLLQVPFHVNLVPCGLDDTVATDNLSSSIFFS